MSLSAMARDRLAAEEVEALGSVIARDSLKLRDLLPLEAAIQNRWSQLTAAHPDLERFTNATTARFRPGTEEFHRAFVGGFPDPPDRPLAWTDEALIYGAFRCVLDHASITSLIAVMLP